MWLDQGQHHQVGSMQNTGQFSLQINKEQQTELMLSPSRNTGVNWLRGFFGLVAMETGIQKSTNLSHEPEYSHNTNHQIC